MINWLNVLHFYQPPLVEDEIIHQVVKNSYQSWVDFLNKHKKVKVTINFTGCLTERLYNSGYQKLLKDFSKIAGRGQIEFLESAAFHPILPLLPEKEIVKQIKINHQINRLRFGKIYKPKGFFLPELAYSDKVAGIIKRLGYKYIILDEISLKTRNKKQETRNKTNNNIKHKLRNGLFVIFRNRKISQSFVPETIINLIENNKIKPNTTFITATDGELYGHHYWNWWPAYSYLTQPLKHLDNKISKNKNNLIVKLHNNKTIIQTITCSEHLKSLKQTKTIKPKPCSWESTPAELKKGIPYALWNNPKNKIHHILWQLANFALQLNWRYKKDPNHFTSRLYLEKGLSSCTWWWASEKDFSHLFAGRAWNPQIIERGAQELLNSIRSLKNISFHQKLKAEKLFSRIRDLVWKRHWRNNNKK